MSARVLLALRVLEARLRMLALGRHLTTDPACRRYVAPRPGSRLDRRSRGFSCEVCLPETPDELNAAMIAAYLDRYRRSL